MTLYYKYIYMPSGIEKIKSTTYKNIYVSDHAFEAMEDEGIPYFDEITFCGKDILEIEIEYHKIKNMVVELPYNEYKNKIICLWLGENPKNKRLKITMKTVFISGKDRMDRINKNDKKYYRPKNLSFEIDDKFNNIKDSE